MNWIFFHSFSCLVQKFFLFLYFRSFSFYDDYFGINVCELWITTRNVWFIFLFFGIWLVSTTTTPNKCFYERFDCATAFHSLWRWQNNHWTLHGRFKNAKLENDSISSEWMIWFIALRVTPFGVCICECRSVSALCCVRVYMYVWRWRFATLIGVLVARWNVVGKQHSFSIVFDACAQRTRKHFFPKLIQFHGKYGV